MKDRPKQILVDSDIWVGYYLANDALHERVVTGLEQLENENYIPIINSQIVGEVATVLSHKQGAFAVRDFVEKVKASEMTIIPITKQLHNSAMAIFTAQDKKGISYVDCINVATLEAMGLDTIYTYDKFYHKRFGIKNLAYPSEKVA